MPIRFRGSPAWRSQIGGSKNTARDCTSSWNARPSPPAKENTLPARSSRPASADESAMISPFVKRAGGGGRVGGWVGGWGERRLTPHAGRSRLARRFATRPRRPDIVIVRNPSGTAGEPPPFAAELRRSGLQPNRNPHVFSVTPAVMKRDGRPVAPGDEVVDGRPVAAGPGPSKRAGRALENPAASEFGYCCYSCESCPRDKPSRGRPCGGRLAIRSQSGNRALSIALNSFPWFGICKCSNS